MGFSLSYYHILNYINGFIGVYMTFLVAYCVIRSHLNNLLNKYLIINSVFFKRFFKM